MKRLIKKSLMNPEMFKGTIKQLGNKGRIILKGIEDYKFSLEQAARIVSNDQNLSQKIIEKKKALDKAAGEIYSIVFDIENIDITQEYQDQQTLINNPNTKDIKDGEDIPSIPNNPPPTNLPPQNNNPVQQPSSEENKSDTNLNNVVVDDKEKDNNEDNNEEDNKDNNEN